MEQTLNPPVRLETLDRALDAPCLLRVWHLSSLDAPTVAAGSSASDPYDEVRLYK